MKPTLNLKSCFPLRCTALHLSLLTCIHQLFKASYKVKPVYMLLFFFSLVLSLNLMTVLLFHHPIINTICCWVPHSGHIPWLQAAEFWEQFSNWYCTEPQHIQLNMLPHQKVLGETARQFYAKARMQKHLLFLPVEKAFHIFRGIN